MDKNMDSKKQALEWASKTNVPVLVVVFGLGWVFNTLSPKYQGYLDLVSKVEAHDGKVRKNALDISELRKEILSEIKAINKDVSDIKVDVGIIKQRTRQ